MGPLLFYGRREVYYRRGPMACTIERKKPVALKDSIRNMQNRIICLGDRIVGAPPNNNIPLHAPCRGGRA